MANLLFKIRSTYTRIGYWALSLPVLLLRFVLHFSYFIPYVPYQLKCKPKNIALAFLESLMYFLDLIGLSAIYDGVSEWLKWSTRPLTQEELELSKRYFGDSINYDVVRVHPSAKYTANKYALAYVSFNTVNHYKSISRDVFVHEMMHVWQHQNLGGIYAVKALHAQYRGNAYDYGGFEGLYQAMLQGEDLLSFNFEQQAEIIQDYCRLSELDALSPMARSVYIHFAGQVLSN